MTKILIADDHPLVRNGIAALLTSALPDCECAEASSLNEAMAILGKDVGFDLITLDLDLPDAKQLEALSSLRSGWPRIPVAILSGSRDASLARASLNAGASGFISKTQDPVSLLCALTAILENGSAEEPISGLADGVEERVLEKVASLTPQQRQVFRLIVDGRQNKQIAYDLDISLQTVKTHVSAVLAKLGVASRTQAAILAKRYALFP